MKLILIDINQKLIESLKKYFLNESDVSIIHGDITTQTADAIVSPANSFGFMDGGVDYAISERFGWDLQDQLQSEIKALPEGELLIGRSLILETGDKRIPYLISSPTMRVPMSFNIHSSVNGYLAMKSTLIIAQNHESINSVLIPGFCTGVGRMNEDISALQMYKAYKEVIKGEKMDFEDFGEAQKYHLDLNETGMIYDY